jgi:hypothetical protein
MHTCFYQESILSHMPRWPALSNALRDSHLHLFKNRNSPDDLEAKTHKQRDAPHVGRADAGHERLFLYAELVTCVREEQDECRACAPLTAIRGLYREMGEKSVGSLRLSAR